MLFGSHRGKVMVLLFRWGLGLSVVKTWLAARELGRQGMGSLLLSKTASTGVEAAAIYKYCGWGVKLDGCLSKKLNWYMVELCIIRRLLSHLYATLLQAKTCRIWFYRIWFYNKLIKTYTVYMRSPLNTEAHAILYSMNIFSIPIYLFIQIDSLQYLTPYSSIILIANQNNCMEKFIRVNIALFIKTSNILWKNVWLEGMAVNSIQTASFGLPRLRTLLLLGGYGTENGSSSKK